MDEKVQETIFYLVLGVLNMCVVYHHYKENTLSLINALNLFTAIFCAMKLAML